MSGEDCSSFSPVCTTTSTPYMYFEFRDVSVSIKPRSSSHYKNAKQHQAALRIMPRSAHSSPSSEDSMPALEINPTSTAHIHQQSTVSPPVQSSSPLDPLALPKGVDFADLNHTQSKNGMDPHNAPFNYAYEYQADDDSSDDRNDSGSGQIMQVIDDVSPVSTSLVIEDPPPLNSNCISVETELSLSAPLPPIQRAATDYSPIPAHENHTIDNSHPSTLESVPLSTTKQLILNSISGYALPGELTAIMGSSGSGKTTLLNVLSGRHASSTSRMCAGTILINGKTVSYQSLSRSCAFVQQSDCLLPSLTVRELITFSAFMKLPLSMTKQDKIRRVDQIIAELGLTECQHLRVGSSGAGDGDSGGSSGGSGSGNGSFNTAAESSADSSTQPPSTNQLNSNSGVVRSGISGGEQRRTSIGMELVCDPQLIFLDECLSGLDSATALSIIKLLKQLAVNRGRTIILTIHSPSSKIFSLIDRLILLTTSHHCNGARIAYQGPASYAMSYFEQFTHLCTSISLKQERYLHITIPDYIMMMLHCKDVKQRVAEFWETHPPSTFTNINSHQPLTLPASVIEEIHLQTYNDELRIRVILDTYALRPDHMPQAILAQMLQISPRRFELYDESLVENDGEPQFHPGSESSLPWLYQFYYLLMRCWMTTCRESTQLKARIFTNIFLGLFVGLLYLNTNVDDPQSSNYNQRSICPFSITEKGLSDMINRVGFIFFVTGMQALITLVSAVLIFTEERALFLREKSSKMYSTSAYFLSKAVIEIPFNTLLSFVFGCIGYALIGMNREANHFLKFLFLLSLLGHSITSMGLLLSCSVPYPIVAVMLCPLTVVPFMLTSGFFINLNTIPVYLQWLSWISPHRYTFTGLMGLEFFNLVLHCSDDEMNTVLINADRAVPESFEYCSMIRGYQVLDLLSLPKQEYWNDVAALIIISIGFRILAFIVLEMSVKENRLAIMEYKRRCLRWVSSIVRCR